MSRIEEIAAQLAGYDPKALGVNGVQSFLAQLVQPGPAPNALIAQKVQAKGVLNLDNGAFSLHVLSLVTTGVSCEPRG